MRKRRETSVWSVVLAGGEGERTREFIERWLGEARPKQYCAFTGARSLFQDAIDRAGAIGPLDRTIAVVANSHGRWLGEQLRDRRIRALLFQPQNRGTAVGLYLALNFVRRVDPEAVVVVHPSDHFIHPRAAFATTLSRSLEAAEHFSDRLVLLGAKPDRPESDYGWIIPGRLLERMDGTRIRTVKRFREKPSSSQAADAMTAGGLWNTLILAGKLKTFWNLAERCLPEMVRRFETLNELPDSLHSPSLHSVYRDMPSCDLSSGLLEKASDALLVMELEDNTWSDWGRPHRILESLRRFGCIGDNALAPESESISAHALRESALGA